MDGFKDTTRMRNMEGGSCFAKGGSVRGAAKVGKVMGEFKAGKLHSGSKSGPTVTNPKQATAIAMSEARKAGAKMPMKKAEGGVARNRLPPIGDSVDSGNRMSKMEAKEERAMSRRVPGAGAMSEREMRQVKKSVPVASRLPLIGASVDSGNRMSRMDAADRAAVLRTTPRAKGGAMEKKAGGLAVMPKGASKNKSPVRKYAEGGAVSEQPYGQVTAAYGAKLRDQIKAGTMTNAQAQAAQNAFAKQEMARRTEAARVPVAVLPKGMPTPPTNDPGGVSAAHRALGKQLQAQIASGQITTAQARDTLNKNSPALRQLADMKAKSQAAAATPDMNKAYQAYMDQQQGSSGGNPVGALRPGVTPQMPAPMYGDGPLRPTTSQLSEYNAGGGKGAWDPARGAFTNAPPMQPPVQTQSPMPIQRPVQAPAALPGAPQTNPRYRMGGLAVTPRGGRY